MGAYIDKGVTDALVLTLQESRKFKSLSKTKQCQRLTGCIVYCPHCFLFLNLQEMVMEHIYYIGVGLMALLVLTDWAMREPL